MSIDSTYAKYVNLEKERVNAIYALARLERNCFLCSELTEQIHNLMETVYGIEKVNKPLLRYKEEKNQNPLLDISDLIVSLDFDAERIQLYGKWKEYKRIRKRLLTLI